MKEQYIDQSFYPSLNPYIWIQTLIEELRIIWNLVVYYKWMEIRWTNRVRNE